MSRFVVSYRIEGRTTNDSVHDIAHALGEKLCSSLPGFHAITGCDSTSFLAGIGKKKARDSFRRSTDHQDSVSHYREEQELNITTTGQRLCLQSIYNTQKASTADELCYFLFCQKKQKNEMLLPTSDCLLQHLKRSTYQAFTWRHALEVMQDLESAEDHG